MPCMDTPLPVPQQHTHLGHPQYHINIPLGLINPKSSHPILGTFPTIHLHNTGHLAYIYSPPISLPLTQYTSLPIWSSWQNIFQIVVLHPSNSVPMEYEQLIKYPAITKNWSHGICLELGRLSQGYKHDTDGTNTSHFISKDDISNIPSYLTVTYARIVVGRQPHKTDPNRVRITVRGDLIHYPGYVATTTSDLITTKILWNSVSSTTKAKY